MILRHPFESMLLHRIALALVAGLGLFASACHHEDPYEKQLPRVPEVTGAPVTAAGASATPWVAPPEGPIVPSSEIDGRAAERLNGQCWNDFQAGTFDAGVRDCEAALAANPYHVMASWNLASCYAALGRKDWALYMLRRVRELEPLNRGLVEEKLRQSHRDAEWQKFQVDPDYIAIAGPG